MEVIQALKELVGRERSVKGICHALHLAASATSAPAVGAMHITCADESEHECVTAFQNGFVQYVLPALKFAQHSPFRLANLGGRYEWGAIPVAEEHYATQASHDAWKLLVVKVNAHVAMAPRDGGGLRFGTLERYDHSSACCGALNKVLSGAVEPFAHPLREAFASEGLDRIARLLDPSRVDPDQRAFLAALSSARLQARAVMMDIQNHQAASPTFYVVLPCVTLNLPGPDSEVLCGVYVADHRNSERSEQYFGLGDDPAAYELTVEHEGIVVTDGTGDGPRPARDHRKLALNAWQADAAHHAVAIHADDRIQRIRRDVEENKHHHHEHGRWLLRSLLVALMEIAPVPAALLLFGYGASGIHHAWRVQRLAGEIAESHEAQHLLHEIHDRVDHLDPAKAQALLELLLEQRRG